MKYFVIAGEASGDLHASNLIKQIKEQDKDAHFKFLGGDLMAEHAGEPIIHYNQMAFMGFWEVLVNYKKIKNNFKICKEELLKFNPDALILVDYPGFNLRMAKFAKEHNIKTFYYISPKVWAWKKSRAKTIRKIIDKMFVIFPFEVDFYKKYNYQVEYVGNPLVDAMQQKANQIVDRERFIEENNLDRNKEIISLVPGSRAGEISSILPHMIEASKNFPDYQFVITGAPGIKKEFYDKFNTNNYPVIFNQTYSVIKHSKSAVVCSGTACLETAFLKVPEVVVYKISQATYLIAKSLIKINWISLVNIILNKTCVQELIQEDLETRITKELKRLNNDEEYRKNMIEDFDKITKLFGTEGTASRLSAQKIVEYLKV